MAAKKPEIRPLPDGSAPYIPGHGYAYRMIKCYYAECKENAPFQSLVDGAPRQLCESHYIVNLKGEHSG